MSESKILNRYKTKSTDYNRLLRVKSSLILLFFISFFFLPVTEMAQAQITKTSRIELNDNSSHVSIVPHLHLTEDPQKKLTYQVVVTRHQNNLRGQRQSSNILNLGPTAPATWMVFSVTNQSSTEDWVLYFGKALDGRFGLAHKIFVRNNNTGETFTRALREENQSGAYGEDFLGPALPIKISKGQTELFVAYIEAESGIANTFSPQLMTEKSYLNMLRFGDLLSGVSIIFFIGMMGFFIALGVLQNNMSYLPFAGYYLANLCLFFMINNTFFATFTLTGELLSVLLASVIVSGLVITKSFLNIDIEKHAENAVLFVIGAVVIFTALFSSVLFDTSSIFDDLLLFVPIFAAALVMTGLSFMALREGKFAANYLTLAWLCLCVGLLITGLSAASIITASASSMSAYWLFMVPQAYFFIMATNTKIQLTEEEERHLRSRENREAHSIARLQQSKESADQARLLRIIERERELMTELREREIQRTEEMRRAKDMADEANRAKSAFLAVVSHEIRTPMTGILGMVKLLTDTKLSKEQTDYADAIQKSGDTMMALLNDILDFEKIESGNMELEYLNFDFPRLVQDVVTLMSGHAVDKGIALQDNIPEDFPHNLIGDPTRLRQVLLNLTNNAIKFTESGNVTVHLHADKVTNLEVNGDYEVYIAVQDTGIGISEEGQKNLFSAFSQADKSTTRKYGGTGLGLAICKRLVEAMGGGIRLDSEEGVGSTFSFSLMMQAGDASLVEEEAPEYHVDIPSLHILIVEDNEMNRKVLQGFLEKDGHTVVLCESGEDAINVVTQQKFDGVFVDINLTGMNGMETTKTIRALPDQSIAQIPVIAITGNISPEDVKEYYEASINGFIPKPIDSEKLAAALEGIYTGDLDNPLPSTEEPGIAQSAIQTEALEEKPTYASEFQQKAAAPPGHEERVRQSQFEDAKKESQENDDQELAPIHQYLQKTQAPQDKKEQIRQNLQEAALKFDEDDDFDSFAEAQTMQEQIQTNEATAQTLDYAMFKNLYDSLGKEQFEELIRGLIEKSDEIVAALEALQNTDHIDDIRGRAHELKGMAANFGVTELANLAKIIEDNATEENLTIALAEIEKLSSTNQRAKDAIASWLGEVAA